MQQILLNLINNTDLSDEIIMTEEQALKYLNYITHKYFKYKSDNNYDILNYKKILYLEETFNTNQEIQQKIQEIKKQVVKDYIFKKQYQKRIKSNVFFDPLTKDDIKSLKYYTYHLPDINKII